MDRGYNFSLGAGDNGNVLSLTNYRDQSRNQNFTYDALNRITAGSTNGNTGAYSWGENYTIDAWGNLMMSPMAGKAHGGTWQCAGDANNRANCLSYDAAGNVTANGGAGYTYNAENRLLSAGGMSYAYDADGNRVKKASGSTGTLYWYGSPGIIAESDLAGNMQHEYVFFGGKRVARIDQPGSSVHYYLSDHLGSTSMVVSSAGVPEEESDYSPFGTEYVVTGGGANRYKFTGKERDSETGLDYFGARYYGSNTGRWMSPDWSAKQEPVPYAKLGNPQSINLYAYVFNSPLVHRDADGHIIDDSSLEKNKAYQKWKKEYLSHDGAK
ncbi:MAG: RHS repeat-associated core domain-containing protein, partial [Candidatus Angelobacter sp.]